MTSPLAGRRGRHLHRLFTRLGFERSYLIDFQIVVTMKVPLPYVEEFAPKGTRPFRVDAEHGLFYVTYMRMKAGNVVTERHPNGIGRFEELLWGIQIQPVQRKLYLPMSLVANALTATDPEARRFLEDEDHYCVHDLAELDLRYDPERIFFSAAAPDETAARDEDAAAGAVRDGSAPFCRVDLSDLPLGDRRWLLLPEPAEVFKPPTEQNARPRRYEFVGLGLVRLLEGVGLPDRSAVTFRDHVFFSGPDRHGNSHRLFGSGVPEMEVYKITVSRPGTAGLQMLTPSVEHDFPGAAR